ncbi:MAG: hypothetical protein JO199_10980 [Candidatus Eremiobacteraeota bacterium]|nr:hypothetical protein [Candidatus Eremiobacteraeota bacterium]
MVWFCLCAAPAAAHPLGNFTINHLASIASTREKIAIVYTVDIAEIPAFQIMHADDASWNASRLQRWAGDEAAIVAAGLHVEIDGTPQVLAAIAPRARLRPGAGGLPTLYWQARFELPIDTKRAHRVRIDDRVYADRSIGWKDVVVSPQIDPTHALTAYPSALIGSPRRNDVASFDVLRGGTIAHATVGGDSAAGEQSASLIRSGMLADLFARPHQSLLLVTLTVLLAFGLGALHGLEPGHGKALLAFTLVGARATIGQAAILAAALTFAHTIAVLLLGVLLFFAAGFASETVFAWIALVSGAAVAIIGARSLNVAIGHAGHDHAHAAAFSGSQPLHFSSAVIAAMSGGIAPCPAAIVVLLTALRLHQVGYGIAIVVIFSLGLAAVLSALGIAVVRGAAWLRRQGGFAKAMRFAPFVTASVISVAGATMLAQGFAQQGIHVPIPLVVAVTLVAIAGYAFVPRHSHGSTQPV